LGGPFHCSRLLRVPLAALTGKSSLSLNLLLSLHLLVVFNEVLHITLHIVLLEDVRLAIWRLRESPRVAIWQVLVGRTRSYFLANVGETFTTWVLVQPSLV